jgi:putative NIF3 family GTP cyclohydrolase 1 type 2
VSVPVAVSDLVASLLEAFPAQWAEAWDRVGLLAGDPTAPAGPVLVSLDASLGSLHRARDAGAQTLLTHHPAYLETPLPTPGYGPARVAFEAVRDGIALVNCHTNLDRAPAGADALPLAAGLRIVGPLESSSQPMDLVTVYVPADAADAVAVAMAAAGAGRLGEYDECSFSDGGVGRFNPREGARPQAGEPAAAPHAVGAGLTAAELRLEMVAPRGRGAGVAVAARTAHPYEEPLITTAEVAIARNTVRLGRLAEPLRPLTLHELAGQVGAALVTTPRYWGEPGLPVTLVATASGSGGSLVRDALAAGASVLLTGELRYHDAVNALEAGLAVIEAGHDATEWPLVPVLAAAAARTAGMKTEDVIVDERPVQWRTA